MRYCNCTTGTLLKKRISSIASLPGQDPSTMLKTELTRRLSPLKERIRQFLTLETGDHKPSHFLHIIWSSQLSPKIGPILIGQPKGDLDTKARYAERIIEASHQPALASSGPLPERNTLLQWIDGVSRQVGALSIKLTHLHSSYRNRHSGNRSSSQNDATFTLCWYHCRYGVRAQKCTQPCSYQQKENPTQQTPMAAYVCTTTTGHLFITDWISKQ
jgi:hypothetical protein